ncbi:MAG: hypothetical protein JNL58_19800 [Planctomyces sp.]|nr:hypothetical protein [Planctomyces sp.]
MKLGWHFSKVNPRFKNREATQGEFFASDTELRAFVREAVQNSLDARRPDHRGPIAVRIFLSGDRFALSPQKAKQWFRGGWDHFQSPQSGLREVPSPDDVCRFIALEDSGTTGLTGDTDQYHEVSGVKNPFYYFFRAEGQSNKLETGRGRWGLGKFVFPRSSRIRSFFGLTVRHDDRRRLLVGQSILRSHEVDGKSYTPDGWFGRKPDGKEAWAPVDDREVIAEFEKDFCLERRKEPGLSLVVPFCDDTWSVQTLTDVVVSDYFFPILNEDLVVTIEGPGKTLVLQSTSLELVLEDCSEDVKSSVQPLIELARWAIERMTSGNELVLNHSCAKGASRWTRRQIDPAAFEKLRHELSEHGRAAIRVPVVVQARGEDSQSSWFDLFLRKDDSGLNHRPVFIRDGLVISEVRSRPVRNSAVVLIATEPGLTRFLGDAENPAHTDWHEETSHFKGKYINGPATLRFIRNAAADLCQMLADEPDEDDSELLLDVFSVGTGSGRPGVAVGFDAKTSRLPTESLKRLKSTARSSATKSFRISKRPGGFRVAGQKSKVASTNHTLPEIEIRIAYDRRSGSALRNFRPEDFQLSSSPIHLESRSARITILDMNVMRIQPEQVDFEVIVSGFDLNRDLFLTSRIMVET